MFLVDHGVYLHSVRRYLWDKLVLLDPLGRAKAILNLAFIIQDGIGRLRIGFVLWEVNTCNHLSFHIAHDKTSNIATLLIISLSPASKVWLTCPSGLMCAADGPVSKSKMSKMISCINPRCHTACFEMSRKCLSELRPKWGHQVPSTDGSLRGKKSYCSSQSLRHILMPLLVYWAIVLCCLQYQGQRLTWSIEFFRCSNDNTIQVLCENICFFSYCHCLSVVHGLCTQAHMWNDALPCTKGKAWHSLSVYCTCCVFCHDEPSRS